MKKVKCIHFIGIGGAGMSGLAEVFHRRGYMVSGSDIKRTKITERLRAIGIRIYEGHSAEHIKGLDYVVYSSCIDGANVEICEATRKNIPVLRRIEALNMLVGDTPLIAVAGAHGKTTTTALLSYILIKAGLDPTVFIGADVDFLCGNAAAGQGDLVVTEADESDGSFLMLKPLYSVTTNIDKEHMDYFLNMDNVIASYKKFIENTKDTGCAFICADDINLKRLAGKSTKKVKTYGLSQDATIQAVNIKDRKLDGSTFDILINGRPLGRLVLPIIGVHNIVNSLAAIGISLDLGVDFSLIESAVSEFRGAERRFAVTPLDSDVIIIDDYAHHPTEIKATLKTFEDSDRRLIVVFQPHRYSRTRYLRDEFGSSFDLAAHLIVTDIYAAHERPVQGVTAMDICDSARKCGHANVNFVCRDRLVNYLTDIIRPGDAVFILGAGDIGELPDKLIRALGENRKI